MDQRCPCQVHTHFTWEEASLNVLKAKNGSSDYQTSFEYLTLFIVTVTFDAVLASTWALVRGDNIGVLTLTFNLRPKTETLAIIARDIALCNASISSPLEVTHTPGIAHVYVDRPSRLAQLGCEDEPLHPALKNSERVEVPM